MTNLAAKKPAPHSPVDAPSMRMDEKKAKPFLIFDADGRQVGGVDEAKLLGDGYVLMKVTSNQGKAATPGASPGLKAAPFMTDVPEIANSQILRLFERLKIEEPAPARAGSASNAHASPAENKADPLAENKRIMAAMRAQEKLNRAQDVLSGALLKPAEFLEARGVTRQSLSKAVRENRIFFIAAESGLRLYPAFFADPTNDRAALEKVSKELGDLPGTIKWQFFTTKKLSLGGITPVEAIRKGDVHKVIAAATGLREQ